MAKARKNASKKRARRNPAVTSYASLALARANGERDFSNSTFKDGDYEYESVDLSGLTMTNSSFEDMSMRGADLSSSDFRGSKFIRTDLEESNLEGASFSSVEVFESILAWVEAVGASFKNAHLQRGMLGEGNFAFVDFTGANISLVRAVNANFKGAEFVNTNMIGGAFGGSDFNNAVFDGASLKGANFFGAEFMGATFKNMDWDGVDLRRTYYVDPVVLQEWWDSEKDKFRHVKGGAKAVAEDLGINYLGPRPGGWGDEGRLRRELEICDGDSGAWRGGRGESRALAR
jgi:uncharacterized protein YjbI with pentapeptide repeats